MRIIVIGDIHGRTIWKDIVNKENIGKKDKVVFLGDYFDSFDINGEFQLNNFRDIMSYKKSNRNVTCLFGNHDYHYIVFTGAYSAERYSGFNPVYALSFKDELSQEKLNLKACHVIDNILFSHAGVTKDWLIDQEYDSYLEDSLEGFVNDLMLFRLPSFRFVGIDPYGDSTISSPIWVRPKSLIKDAIADYTQVVGHTQLNEIENHKSDIGTDLWFCDTLEHGKYLVIKDGEFLKKEL